MENLNTIYRIQTEDKNRADILALVSRYFPGFTVQSTTGYYKGVQEPSLSIEVMATSSVAHVMRFICKVIAQQNNQECVLLASYPVNGELVS